MAACIVIMPAPDSWASTRLACQTAQVSQLLCRSLAVSGCHNLTATGLEAAAYSLRLQALEADDLPGAGEGVAAIVANMPLLAAGASAGNPASAR